MGSPHARGLERPGQTWEAGPFSAWTPPDPHSHRNRRCPCGSDKRFKHCSGDLEPRRVPVPTILIRELLEQRLRALLEARVEDGWKCLQRGCHGRLSALPNQAAPARSLPDRGRVKEETCTAQRRTARPWAAFLGQN